jgi:hypothetical protein
LVAVCKGLSSVEIYSSIRDWRLFSISSEERVNASYLISIKSFLKDSKNKVGVDFLEACMEFLDAKVEIKGLENLPENGKCTFVSNHPLGGQDGVALGYILGKHYNGNVRYLVNDLLMNLHGLAPLCIPINKTGSQSRDFPKMVEAGFASDNHIIMFPAGLCSRRQGGEIKDLEKNWKKLWELITT